VSKISEVLNMGMAVSPYAAWPKFCI